MNINVTTFLNQLGYGIAGLNVVKALARAGHAPALWVNGPGQCPAEDRAAIEAAVARTQSYDPDAPSLRISHQWDMAHRVGRGVHAGLTFFELNRLTDAERHHLSCLDIVYVPSAWAANVLYASGVPKEKLAYAPLGVDPAIFHPGVEGGLPPGHEGAERWLRESRQTVFLNCGKWSLNKGHDILIEAFKMAFTRQDNVVLIMNCHNPTVPPPHHAAAYNLEWESLYRLSDPVGGKVLILPERLPRQQDVARVMALADCGVFPARAEGWNLELLEMMAVGKTCIATNYAAHTEFCTPENCLLVEPDGLETAYDGVYFTSGHGEWAELGQSAVEQLAGYMRSVHLLKQAGNLEPNLAGLETARFFTWDNTVTELMSTLL